MSPDPVSSELLYFTELGSGPPLLLIHGLMISGEMFAPVIEQLEPPAYSRSAKSPVADV